VSAPLPNREIWLRAGTILAEHGDRSAEYVIEQLAESLGDHVAVEDWRRVAAAVDFIADAEPSS
jgi:hypothetical protein